MLFFFPSSSLRCVLNPLRSRLPFEAPLKTSSKCLHQGTTLGSVSGKLFLLFSLLLHVLLLFYNLMPLHLVESFFCAVVINSFRLRCTPVQLCISVCFHCFLTTDSGSRTEGGESNGSPLICSKSLLAWKYASTSQGNSKGLHFPALAWVFA